MLRLYIIIIILLATSFAYASDYESGYVSMDLNGADNESETVAERARLSIEAENTYALDGELSYQVSLRIGGNENISNCKSGYLELKYRYSTAITADSETGEIKHKDGQLALLALREIARDTPDSGSETTLVTFDLNEDGEFETNETLVITDCMGGTNETSKCSVEWSKSAYMMCE
jgi:hypothetical protein